MRQLDVPCIAVNLEPVFGSIDDYPPIIDAAVTRMTEQTGLAPVIVAHSMGGLASRAWLRSHGSVSRFHHVVTIASPHHGTWLARFALTANGRQMRLASRWVSDLAAVERSEIRGRFTCFHGSCDNIVFPVGTATLHDADNQHLPGVAHPDMVSVPGVSTRCCDAWRSEPSSGWPRWLACSGYGRPQLECQRAEQVALQPFDEHDSSFRTSLKPCAS